MENEATELLNECKTESDVSQKIYLLEQLKELCLNRSPDLLIKMASGIFNLSVERNTQIRQFLIKFASQAIERNALIIPFIIPMYFHLRHDGNDAIVRALSLELATSYDKLAMHIANMSVTEVNKAKDLWEQLSNISSYMISLLSSDKPEVVRNQCIRFVLETYVLFGIPEMKAKPVDPRKARRGGGATDTASSSSSSSSGGATGGSKMFTSGDIPALHPFIKREDVQRESEGLFASMEDWARSNGPRDQAFTPAQMAQLCQALSRVGTRRPHLWERACDAIIFMLQGEGGLKIDQLTNACVQQCIKAVNLSLQYTPSSTPPRYQTIQEDLKICIAVLNGDISGLQEKKLKEIKTQDQDQTQISSNIGVDSRNINDDNAPSKKRARIEHHEMYDNIPSPIDREGTELKLADGLVRYDEQVMTSGASLTGRAAAEALSRVSIASLHRVWDSQSIVDKFGDQAHKLHIKLSVRSALTVALAALEQDDMTYVEVLKTTPKNTSDMLINNVPAYVRIPKPLWYFLSSFLMRSAKGDKADRLYQMEYILQLLWETFRRARISMGLINHTDNNDDVNANDDDNDDDDDDLAEEVKKKGKRKGKKITKQDKKVKEENKNNNDSTANTNTLKVKAEDDNSAYSLHDTLCLVVFSRIIQRSQLSDLLSDFACQLSRISDECLNLIVLIAHTAPATVANSMISLLEKLCLSENEQINRKALICLLRMSISPSFEMRTVAVLSLRSKVVPTAVWAQEMVFHFAIMMASKVVGGNRILQRAQERDFTLERLSVVEQKQDEVEGVEKGNEEAIKDDDKMDTEWESSDNIETDIVVVEEVDVTAYLPSKGLLVTTLSSGSGDCSDKENDNSDVTNIVSVVLESSSSSDEDLDVDKFSTNELKEYCKCMLQLITQLCLSEASLLTAIFDIYATALRCKSLALDDTDANADCSNFRVTKATTSSSITENTDTNETEMEIEGETSTTTTTTTTTTSNELVTPWNTVVDMITAYVKGVLPSLGSKHSIPTVLSFIVQTDTLAAPLVISSLEILHSNLQIPALSKSLYVVQQFCNNKLNSNEIDNKDSKAMEAKARGVVICGHKTVEIVEEELKYLIQVFATDDSMDLIAMKNIFARLTRGRPPMMSKANLLVYLHRFNVEEVGIKSKVILDLISACLEARDEYNGESIRGCISLLLEDEILATALMRTAIMGAKSHSDVKKFVVTDVIPRLIRKKIWESQPKIWDGVVLATKNYSAHTDAEATLRSVLGLPIPQLKSVIKVASAIKPLLKNILAAFSTTERDDVLSGRWMGVEDADLMDPAVKLETLTKLLG